MILDSRFQILDSAPLQNAAAVVLAAGRGTRMKAKSKNKVAFKLNGQAMIAHTVDHLRSAGISQIIAVVGYQADSVRAALKDKVVYAIQSEQLGTGDAIKSALPYISSHITSVLALYGDDSAFYPPDLFTTMIAKKEELGCDLLFLTIHKDDPTGLGRIVRDSSGEIVSIIEEKVATEKEKKIQEINTGFYCFDKNFLINYIDRIQKNPVSGEYYLTDIVEIALKNHKKVEALFVKDSTIWYGINNRSDFAKAKHKLIT
ncbi:MAG: sugar phosphate nucleotidyltransferase [bacterium]